MLDELLRANRFYAAHFSGQGQTAPPTRRLAVLTCMDSRVDPPAALGLAPGEAVVVRNAGGRVTADALRSLIIATRLLGVERVVVLHHSDCALAKETEDSVRARLEDAGVHGADQWRFLAMPDPDGALRDDVDALLTFPLIPAGLEVAGWRYDVTTGAVTTVVPPGHTRAVFDQVPGNDHHPPMPSDLVGDLGAGAPRRDKDGR